MNTRKRLGLTIRLTALLAVTALSLAGASLAHVQSAQNKNPQTRYFCGIGKVVSIDDDRSGVKISHHAIEGYMPAMTMHFKTVDTEVLGDVAGGDTVRFTLKDTPELTRLIYIEKIAPNPRRQRKR